jgi:predicted Zn-ribbon and HTH transcriptional regulator
MISELKELVCKVCGWKWVARVREPKYCPRCHSPKWGGASIA